jgi:hypothetical protein
MLTVGEAHFQELTGSGLGPGGTQRSVARPILLLQKTSIYLGLSNYVYAHLILLINFKIKMTVKGTKQKWSTAADFKADSVLEANWH